MGGGGGSDDGGTAARAAADKAQKDAATATVNDIFGIGSAAPVTTAGPAVQAGRGITVPGAVQVLYAPGDGSTAAANKAAREQEYQELHDAVYDYQKDALDQNRDDALRKLSFALARTGLFGGSEDVDQNTQMQQDYDKGILNIGNLADAKAADMRTADEKTRLNILSNIQAGMDAGSATSAALNAMQLNADNAKASADADVLSNLFDRSAYLYNQANGNGSALNAQQKYNLGAYSPVVSFDGTINRGDN